MQALDELKGTEIDDHSILKDIVRGIEELIINISLILFVLPICLVMYALLFIFDRDNTKHL